MPLTNNVIPGYLFSSMKFLIKQGEIYKPDTFVFSSSRVNNLSAGSQELVICTLFLP